MSVPKNAKSLYWFDVDDSGTLTDPLFVAKTRRVDLYSNIARDWNKSPANLVLEMGACPPLAWCIHELYSNARDALEEQLDDVDVDTRKGKAAAVKLRAKLDDMPAEPEGNADRWLANLDDKTFSATVVPAVDKWLADEPDYRWEDDYVDRDSSAEGAAFQFFRALDHDELDAMGVGMVEGDRPGSNLCYAVLQVDVKVANRGAEKTHQPFRFRRKQSTG